MKKSFSFLLIFLLTLPLLGYSQTATQYLDRGIAKAELNDYKGAIGEFTKAIEINPKDAEAYAYRGNAKTQIQDYIGSIPDFTKAIEIDPKNMGASYCNRGLVKDKLKDYDGAYDDYSKAIELYPRIEVVEIAYIGRGLINFNRDNYIESVSYTHLTLPTIYSV